MKLLKWGIDSVCSSGSSRVCWTSWWCLFIYIFYRIKVPLLAKCPLQMPVMEIPTPHEVVFKTYLYNKSCVATLYCIDTSVDVALQDHVTTSLSGWWLDGGGDYYLKVIKEQQTKVKYRVLLACFTSSSRNTLEIQLYFTFWSYCFHFQVSAARAAGCKHVLQTWMRAFLPVQQWVEPLYWFAICSYNEKGLICWHGRRQFALFFGLHEARDLVRLRHCVQRPDQLP